MSDMNFSLACVAAYIYIYFYFYFFLPVNQLKKCFGPKQEKCLFPKEIKKINQCSLPVSLIVLVSLHV